MAVRVSGKLPLMKTLTLFLILFAIPAVQAKPKYGPEGAPKAATLAQDNAYFRKNPAPDFWAMIGYYVPQFNGAACSAASVAVALNGARATLSKTADDKVVPQEELLDKIKVENWKERLSKKGWGPKKIYGTSLEVLGKVAQASFRAYGFPKAEVDVVEVKDMSDATVEKIRDALKANEKSADDFIIANFNQKLYTDDAEAGHIAAIGAYDADKKRVLILDPDREYYEPYWVSEKVFIEGMNTKGSEGGGFRGYIVVRTNKG